MNNTILPLSEIHIGDRFKLLCMGEIFEVKEIDFGKKMVTGEIYRTGSDETIYPWWVLYDPRRSRLFSKERLISNEAEAKQ